jgi:hypothetical protein
MGIATGTRGHVTARENRKIVRKANDSMLRLKREMMATYDIVIQPPSLGRRTLIYETYRGFRRYRLENDRLMGDVSAVPGSRGERYLIAQGVRHFSLNHFRKGRTGSTEPWTAGEDPFDDLYAIEIVIVFENSHKGGEGITFTESVKMNGG